MHLDLFQIKENPDTEAHKFVVVGSVKSRDVAREMIYSAFVLIMF